MPAEIARYAVTDRILLIEIDSPPVNALSFAVRVGLIDGMARAAGDDVDAVVIACAGQTFFAGADIAEFDSGMNQPDLHEVIDRIEGSPKPVIAAIHGTALGGGLETALACHYRIAAKAAKLGLPEVSLGLLPGGGGTQRLPRLVGPAAALEMMVLGKPIGAARALDTGLIDQLVPGESLAADAILFARQVVAEGRPLRRVRDLADKLGEGRDPALFAEFRNRNAKAMRGLMAPEHIVKAVEAAVSLPFDEGMKREAELFVELLASNQSAALRHLFFAQRAAGKVPGLDPGARAVPITSVAVIGAGTMGGGIAMSFLDRGMHVTILDRTPEVLDRGVAIIRSNYDGAVAKGRLGADEGDRRMKLLNPTLNWEAVASADLVIEAVFERLDLKQDVFTRLDGIAKADAILASNTSFLDLDMIAASTRRPGQVIGLHFFSPANIMPLLEVVRGAETSATTVATAMKVARVIGKTAVLSRVCDGFIANRAMAVRSAAADRLILEGPMPWDVDRAMTAFGFPMGPFAMSDLVGLDVIGWDASTTSSASVLEVLCEMDRWGQKKGGGYYDYDDRRRGSPSPIAERIIRDFAVRSGWPARSFADREIVERLLFPVVNEGARILEEGIALRGSDIDIALTMGYGWPAHTGGPMFWADSVGLASVVDGLEVMAAAGDPKLAPCSFLRELAMSGAKLSGYVSG